jgi:uncharacterized membrane protein YhaH (DUF805 family)
MEFVNAINISLKKYFDFSTRSSRSEYWFFTLFVLLVSIIGYFLEYLFYQDLFLIKLDSGQMTYSELIVNILLTIPGVSLSVRRLHDINRSGWWLLLTFTIIGIIPLIYWSGFKKGDEGDNRFGKK